MGLCHNHRSLGWREWKNSQPLFMTKDTETMEDLSDLLTEGVDSLSGETEESSEEVLIPIANLQLQLDKYTQVPLRGVTPAEVLLLVAEHHAAAGGNPIKGIASAGTVKTSAVSEKQRLLRKYSAAKVEKAFPGAVPKLPTTFREALRVGLATNLPKEDLMEYRLTA